MNRLFAIFFAGFLSAFLFCAPARAQQPQLSISDQLMMKHIIMSLWDMHYTAPERMNAATLCQKTLFYITRAEPEAFDSRDTREEFFTNIPENYQLFFPKDLVASRAMNIFNGWISEKDLPAGIFLGASGYYMDPQAFFQSSPYDETSDLPRFAEIQTVNNGPDSSVVVNGTLRCFKITDSGEYIVWGIATFMANFTRTEKGWKLDSFVISEEGVG